MQTEMLPWPEHLHFAASLLAILDHSRLIRP